jgi:hypothetical protein
VNGSQAQLVLRHVLKVLVEAHQFLLIVELTATQQEEQSEGMAHCHGLKGQVMQEFG